MVKRINTGRFVFHFNLVVSESQVSLKIHQQWDYQYNTVVFPEMYSKKYGSIRVCHVPELRGALRPIVFIRGKGVQEKNLKIARITLDTVEDAEMYHHYCCHLLLEYEGFLRRQETTMRISLPTIKEVFK